MSKPLPLRKEAKMANENQNGVEGSNEKRDGDNGPKVDQQREADLNTASAIASGLFPQAENPRTEFDISSTFSAMASATGKSEGLNNKQLTSGRGAAMASGLQAEQDVVRNFLAQQRQSDVSKPPVTPPTIEQPSTELVTAVDPNIQRSVITGIGAGFRNIMEARSNMQAASVNNPSTPHPESTQPGISAQERSPDLPTVPSGVAESPLSDRPAEPAEPYRARYGRPTPEMKTLTQEDIAAGDERNQRDAITMEITDSPQNAVTLADRQGGNIRKQVIQIAAQNPDSQVAQLIAANPAEYGHLQQQIIAERNKNARISAMSNTDTSPVFPQSEETKIPLPREEQLATDSIPAPVAETREPKPLEVNLEPLAGDPNGSDHSMEVAISNTHPAETVTQALTDPETRRIALNLALRNPNSELTTLIDANPQLHTALEELRHPTPVQVDTSRPVEVAFANGKSLNIDQALLDHAQTAGIVAPDLPNSNMSPAERAANELAWNNFLQRARSHQQADREVQALQAPHAETITLARKAGRFVGRIRNGITRQNSQTTLPSIEPSSASGTSNPTEEKSKAGTWITHSSQAKDHRATDASPTQRAINAMLPGFSELNTRVQDLSVAEPGSRYSTPQNTRSSDLYPTPAPPRTMERTGRTNTDALDAVRLGTQDIALSVANRLGRANPDRIAARIDVQHQRLALAESRANTARERHQATTEAFQRVDRDLTEGEARAKAYREQHTEASTQIATLRTLIDDVAKRGDYNRILAKRTDKSSNQPVTAAEARAYITDLQSQLEQVEMTAVGTNIYGKEQAEMNEKLRKELINARNAETKAARAKETAEGKVSTFQRRLGQLPEGQATMPLEASTATLIPSENPTDNPKETATGTGESKKTRKKKELTDEEKLQKAVNKKLKEYVSKRKPWENLETTQQVAILRQIIPTLDKDDARRSQMETMLKELDGIADEKAKKERIAFILQLLGAMLIAPVVATAQEAKRRVDKQFG